MLHTITSKSGLVTRILISRIAIKRVSAVSKEVLAELSTGKKMTKAEKDERIAWKKNEVAESEATTFAIFYINTLFLFLMLCAFYFMRSFNPVLYPASPVCCRTPPPLKLPSK